MTPEPKEIGSGKDLAARSPEIDFAVVLSRVIGSIEDDPAQLRNAVYELARIKLRREAWQRDPPLNLWEARHLTLALEGLVIFLAALPLSSGLMAIFRPRRAAATATGAAAVAAIRD
jgi:hypothetical protein